MIKAAIVGATGYTGFELIRALINHPIVEITVVTSETYKDKSINESFGGLANLFEKRLIEFDPDIIANEAEVAFVCLPHGESMHKVKELYERGLKVIDLSADFRIKDINTYEKWYKTKHVCPDIIEKAVYGLCEIYRDEIASADIVANPGCYAASVILALYPLVKYGLVQSMVIADCKSGVTGGGRKLNLRFHFPECNENFCAYSTGGHRHNPEIEHILSRFSESHLDVLFIPHLIPMNRGILSTIYINMANEYEWDDIYDIYKEFYSDEPFIRLKPPNMLPQTKDVRGTNFCDIGWQIRKDKDTIVVISALDNLGKGASLCAIQNMNVMMQIEETAGLNFAPLVI